MAAAATYKQRQSLLSYAIAQTLVSHAYHTLMLHYLTHSIKFLTATAGQAMLGRVGGILT
jgi:hypothetical protein